MISILYECLSVQELVILLSRYEGWCDADKRSVIIVGKKEKA